MNIVPAKHQHTSVDLLQNHSILTTSTFHLVSSIFCKNPNIKNIEEEKKNLQIKSKIYHQYYRYYCKTIHRPPKTANKSILLFDLGSFIFITFFKPVVLSRHVIAVKALVELLHHNNVTVNCGSALLNQNKANNSFWLCVSKSRSQKCVQRLCFCFHCANIVAWSHC